MPCAQIPTPPARTKVYLTNGWRRYLEKGLYFSRMLRATVVESQFSVAGIEIHFVHENAHCDPERGTLVRGGIHKRGK